MHAEECVNSRDASHATGLKPIPHLCSMTSSINIHLLRPGLMNLLQVYRQVCMVALAKVFAIRFQLHASVQPI